VREAASKVSGQGATDRSSADQRPPAKSLADLRKLADRGDADAQWQLGVRYHNGEDVPRDDVQAMQWFLRAAEQGHVTAQATLGAYYWAGRGVPQDLSRAYFWSALALAQGDENSKSRLEGLASQMTQAQVSAARQQAEVWLRQHNAAKPARN
jgi:TPR repeat protein